MYVNCDTDLPHEREGGFFEICKNKGTKTFRQGVGYSPGKTGTLRVGSINRELYDR